MQNIVSDLHPLLPLLARIPAVPYHGLVPLICVVDRVPTDLFVPAHVGTEDADANDAHRICVILPAAMMLTR
jgi:hypothetical protein